MSNQERVGGGSFRKFGLRRSTAQGTCTTKERSLGVGVTNLSRTSFLREHIRFQDIYIQPRFRAYPPTYGFFENDKAWSKKNKKASRDATWDHRKKGTSDRNNKRWRI